MTVTTVLLTRAPLALAYMISSLVALLAGLGLARPPIIANPTSASTVLGPVPVKSLPSTVRIPMLAPPKLALCLVPGTLLVLRLPSTVLCSCSLATPILVPLLSVARLPVAPLLPWTAMTATTVPPIVVVWWLVLRFARTFPFARP